MTLRRSRLPLLALSLSLAACNNEDVIAARQRANELETEFVTKAALITSYPAARAEIEKFRAEVAALPDKPLLPDLPPPLAADVLEDAKTALFPPKPAQRMALLAALELRQLESHEEDAEEEIAKLDAVLEPLQDLVKLKRKLEAAKIALAAERGATPAVGKTK
jgi:hypothetical protein